MVSGDVKTFTMRVSKREVVASALPLREHWLPLSNLDLLLPPLEFGVFFCYAVSKPPSFASMVGVLKKALAQALVSFYPFAGELVHNPHGEPELLCNNRGVDFVEAFADVELHQLDLYNPDDSVEGKLVPDKKYGVLAVQATELRCGGTVVACTFDHRIADAYSANMFLVSWADMAQSKPFNLHPSFRRSLLNPRRPGRIHPSLNDMYVPITDLPPPKDTSTATAAEEDHHLISRIYYVKAEQLERLQALCNKRTKLESFSAFLWKIVAECAAADGPEKVCKMGIVVDGRKLLSTIDDEENNVQGGDKGINVIRSESSAMMESYFGNVLSIPFGGKKVEELTKKPLSWVAEEVHEFLVGAVTKEHFLGLIDWVEARRPVPGLARIYCLGREDGPAFVVSSGQRFPVSKIDFGWGKPVFGSYHFPWGGDAGYVMPMPSPAGNGDWVVYMHMSKKQLEAIEKEASHVFRPFTFECLDFVKN